MIQTTEQTTTVKFADSIKARILLSAKTNILTLQEIKGEFEVGENGPHLDGHELPKIIMEFNNTKSIDALISKLKRIKNNIEDRQAMYVFASAC
jgi:hypothetical protein